MSIFKIQGSSEKREGIYYEFDSDQLLGEGGMGKVYKGRCVNQVTHESRDVAVKFMYSDLPPYAIEKARREAAIHFRHDNLIEMLGFIETESKGPLGDIEHHYHVVSELLEGTSLDKLFEGKLTDQRGNFVSYADKLYKAYQNDVEQFSVEVIKNILSGLMSMHDAGYIHRDIDPTNIMITSDGHIKLIDFGIAKKMKLLTTGDKHLTQAGQFVGKPEYAAPELVLGAIDEQNQTTDIYAVGILLFQCLVGRVPFKGDRSEVLHKQLRSPLPLKLVKNKDLRNIIEKATEKTRSKRFQSAAEFRVALDRLDLDKIHTDSIFTRLIKKPVVKFAAAAVAVGAIAAAAIPYIDFSKDEKEEVIKTISYSEALNALRQPEESSKGLEYLSQLSDEGDGEATYLLSRLYFQSHMNEDTTPDSISAMRKGSGLKTDNIKAHALLKKSIDQNPKNYQALFDLACDYWKAEQRTEAVTKRDGDKAEQYFNEALKYAQESGDEEYVNLINGYLDKIGQWRENLSIIETLER